MKEAFEPFVDDLDGFSQRVDWTTDTKWEAIDEDLFAARLGMDCQGADDKAGGIYPAGRCRLSPAPPSRQ